MDLISSTERGHLGPDYSLRGRPASVPQEVVYMSTTMIWDRLPVAVPPSRHQTRQNTWICRPGFRGKSCDCPQKFFACRDTSRICGDSSDMVT